MKHEETFKEKIDSMSHVITLFLTVTGVVVAVATLWIANIISPFTNHLNVLDARVQAVEDDRSQLERNMVTKSEFTEAESRSTTRDNDIIHRLDIISQRLDSFIRK